MADAMEKEAKKWEKTKDIEVKAEPINFAEVMAEQLKENQKN